MSNKTNPTPLALQPQYNVVRPGEWEAVNEPLYDFQTYALAGTTQQYRFFSVPLGQGATPKTYEDTNMELAGQLSAGLKFEVRAIEIALFPGVNPSPAVSAPAVSAFVNDMWSIFKAGFLQVNVLAKPYIRLGPLGNFPFTKRLDGWAAIADTTTAAAAQQTRVSYAAWGGQQFQVTPFSLLPNMNFDVTLNFPTTAAISANARIGVILRGIKSRLSQ
ncbi:MAG TPA: hypothetical protein VFZ38_19350 [Vicinamibacterales bacterium]